jgi:hypothetical protein
MWISRGIWRRALRWSDNKAVQIKGTAARRISIVFVSLISCLVVLLGVNEVVMWFVGRQEVQPSSIIVTPPGTAQSDDDRPRRYPLPADLLLALQTPNDFQIRHRISDIPGSVRVAFARAAHLDGFSMAEPGVRWQATDVIAWPELPWRRLIGVASTGSFCLIFYEHGGFGNSYNVAAFRLSPGGVEAIGHTYLDQGVADPAALRLAIKGEKEPGLDAAYF